MSGSFIPSSILEIVETMSFSLEFGSKQELIAHNATYGSIHRHTLESHKDDNSAKEREHIRDGAKMKKKTTTSTKTMYMILLRGKSNLIDHK